MKLATTTINVPNNDIAKPVAKFSFISFNSSKNMPIPHNVRNAPNNIAITKKITKGTTKKNLLTFIINNVKN